MTAKTAAQSEPSSRVTPGLLASLWPWLATFARATSGFCNQLLRRKPSASAQTPPESAATVLAEAAAEDARPERLASKGPVAQDCVSAPVIDLNLDPVSIKNFSQTVPDAQEIERRRSLVRTLFNEFWNEAHERPARFVERLDQAEDYLNARLAAHGEPWRLDATARALLGLPARSKAAPKIG